MAKRVPLGLAIGLLVLFGEYASQAQAISFQRYNNVPIGAGVQDVSAGDFNGDGKLDLVASSASNLLLLLGNGDGTFKNIDLDFVAQFTLVADVNRDGKPDLLVSVGFQAYLLLGNGDGTFQPAKPLPVFPLAVADFNGDGIPDLLFSPMCVCSRSIRATATVRSEIPWGAPPLPPKATSRTEMLWLGT